MRKYGQFIRVNGRRISFRIFLILLLGVVLLPACRKNTRPKGVLSEQQMVKVLTELYIQEEKVGRLGIRYDSSLLVMNQLKSKVFEQEGVSDADFDKSLYYYWDRPKELERIYDIMIDSMNLRVQKMSIPQAQ